MTTAELTTTELADLVKASTELGAGGKTICLRILDEHTPEVPPEGQQWLPGGRDPHCAACSSGDPFWDGEWPCSTVRVISETLDPAPEPEASEGLINFND
jgi:hypothetical protein